MSLQHVHLACVCFIGYLKSVLSVLMHSFESLLKFLKAQVF